MECLYCFFLMCITLYVHGKKNYLKKHYYGWTVLILTPFLYYFAIYTSTAYMENDPFLYIHKGILPITQGVVGNLMGYKKFYFLLLGLVLSLIIPHKERSKQFVFLVILVVSPILLILWSCVANHYWFVQRLFIWVMPWFAFLIGWCWDSIFVYSKKKYFPLAEIPISED